MGKWETLPAVLNPACFKFPKSFLFALSVFREDAADVGTRFCEGRNAVVLGDSVGAGVVSGKSKRQILPVFFQQLFQVSRAGIHILRGIEGVSDIKSRSRIRHELHQSAGAFAGNGARIEIGLRNDETGDEVFVHAVFLRGGADQIRKGRSGRSFAGEEWKVVFGFDGDDFFGADCDVAASNVKVHNFAFVLVAGDVQTLAVAKDGGFSECGRSVGKHRQKRDENKESGRPRYATQGIHLRSKANCSMAAATPLSSLERVTCQPSWSKPGTLLPMTIGTPAYSSISRSL